MIVPKDPLQLLHNTAKPGLLHLPLPARNCLDLAPDTNDGIGNVQQAPLGRNASRGSRLLPERRADSDSLDQQLHESLLRLGAEVAQAGGEEMGVVDVVSRLLVAVQDAGAIGAGPGAVGACHPAVALVDRLVVSGQDVHVGHGLVAKEATDASVGKRQRSHLVRPVGSGSVPARYEHWY